MGTPLDGPRQPLDGPREALDGAREALKIVIGLGAGLIPAACAIGFYATLCYGASLTPDCHEPTNGLDVDFFVGAIIGYLLQVVAAVVCVIFRATRPVALGLLIMLVVGPLVALVGIGDVFMLKAPHATNFGADSRAALLMLPLMLGCIARSRR